MLFLGSRYGQKENFNEVTIHHLKHFFIFLPNAGTYLYFGVLDIAIDVVFCGLYGIGRCVFLPLIYIAFFHEWDIQFIPREFFWYVQRTPADK